MATLLPVICTATVTNDSKLVTVTGTDQSTGLPPVLSDLNCRPNGTVFIAGVGYLVGERLSTTTFNFERNYEGINASGLSCTIGVFTPEMANRAELATQLREYSALLALLRQDWNGLVYTLISPTGAADPGSGNLAFNHATPASITGMYMDVNDARGRTVTGQVMTWRQGTQVRTQSLATGAFITVELAATPTNQGPDEWISNAGLSIVESYGTLAPGETVAVIYIPSAAGLDPDYTVELLAGRAAYDGAAAGIQVLVNDVGDGRAAIYTKLSATSADWSTAAYVTGGVGPQGDKGWSPQLVGVSDGARRVLKLAGYVGGAGTAPTANVGQYLKADGTFTATIGDAADFRGPGGAAGIAGGGLKGIACRVVITTNVDLAGGGIAAGTTHDGVTLDANDLVLVAGQTAPAENGPYPAPAAGAASRHVDFDAWDELVAAYFPVSEGTTNADTLWRNMNAKGGTLGTTALVFVDLVVTPGIKFPATQVPSADANTLDDYEEGTWTPVIAFGGASAGVTYLSQSGTVLKIGRFVIAVGRISLSSKGSSTGPVSITGLPYTNSASIPGSSVGFRSNYVGLTGDLNALVVSGAASILLYQATATGQSAITDANISNNLDTSVTAIYIAAS